MTENILCGCTKRAIKKEGRGEGGENRERGGEIVTKAERRKEKDGEIEG